MLVWLKYKYRQILHIAPLPAGEGQRVGLFFSFPNTIFAFLTAQNCELSARGNLLLEIFEFYACSLMWHVHNELWRMLAWLCNFLTSKRSPFRCQKDSFCSTIKPPLHCKRAPIDSQYHYFCNAMEAFLLKNTMSGTMKTTKNALRNLQNQFFVCNTFLLYVRYFAGRILNFEFWILSCSRLRLRFWIAQFWIVRKAIAYNILCHFAIPHIPLPALISPHVCYKCNIFLAYFKKN